MNTKNNLSAKERFIVKQMKQISLYEKAIEVLNEAKNVVLKFDDKVINKRIETAFKSIVEPDSNIYVHLNNNGFSLFGQTSITFTFSGNYREIYTLNEDSERVFYGYVDDNIASINLISKDKNSKRLNAKETIKEIDLYIALIQNKINRLNDCIENYDTYLEKSKEIEKMIETYQKEVPYIIQHNIILRRNDYLR